jgi:phage shock protein E
MKRLFLSLPLVFATLAPLGAETPKAPAPAPAAAAAGVKHVDAPAAAKVLEEAAKSPEKKITVIDVRTPEEFAEGHIKGAQNVDIASPDFAKELAKLDPAKTYLVHCAAGGRSTRSLSILNKLGFKSVMHLDGGLNGWKKAGLPLETPAAPAK